MNEISNNFVSFENYMKKTSSKYQFQYRVCHFFDQKIDCALLPVKLHLFKTIVPVVFSFMYNRLFLLWIIVHRNCHACSNAKPIQLNRWKLMDDEIILKFWLSIWFSEYYFFLVNVPCIMKYAENNNFYTNLWLQLLIGSINIIRMK